MVTAMVKGSLILQSLEDNNLGLLTPEDLHLFYYDIGFDTEIGHSVVYKWDENVEKYIKENNLYIDNRNISSIPHKFSENQMFFTIGDDDDNKAVAFFRHLRNAFSHYLIGVSGDNYCMKDFRDDNTITMIGKINRQQFRDMINVFFAQKADAEEEYLNSITPTI